MSDSVFKLKSPFNYAGSKQNTLEFLFSNFPKDKEIFFDMFVGGGSVSITATHFYQRVIMNDVLTPLVNMYLELKNKPYDFIVESLLKYKLDKNDKEGYQSLRTNFNRDKNDPYKFYACLCHCNNNLVRFNSKLEFNQTWGNRSFNNKTFEKLKTYSDVLFQNPKVILMNTDFSEIWKTFKKSAKELNKVFFYLDPPYIQTDAGYNVFWSQDKEDSFWDMIDDMKENNISFGISNTLKHKGVLNPSYNRFKNLKIIEVPEFFNKARKKETDKESIEVLISND